MPPQARRLKKQFIRGPTKQKTLSNIIMGFLYDVCFIYLFLLFILSLVVLLFIDAYTAVFLCILLHNLQRLVLGTIVDNDEFPVGKSLGDDTIYGFRQKISTVVTWENDGNDRGHNYNGKKLIAFLSIGCIVFEL